MRVETQSEQRVPASVPPDSGRILSRHQRRELRRSLLTLLFESHSGHIGSCLSCLDILGHVWFHEKRVQDVFILSKGHAAPGLYVVLHAMGRIDEAELRTFHQDGTRLPAHTPNHHFRDVIPFPTGSLGHGLSLGCGIAHAALLRGIDRRVYVLLSDGECNSGQVWEAAQYASGKGLGNLIAMVDRNRFQAFGKTADVLGDAAAAPRWRAFGFETFEGDGHDPESLARVFLQAAETGAGKPKALIFDTVKGHGVSFMENTIEWHYWPMNSDQHDQAISDIQML